MCHAPDVSETAAVPPETRDVAFVMTWGCADCGFTPQVPEETGERLRDTIATWQTVLTRGPAALRPAPTV